MPRKPYGSRGGKTRVARAVAANRVYTQYGGYKAVRGAQTLQAAIRRAINKNNEKMIETKQGCQTSTDGVEIFHNNFVTLNSQVLFTTYGPNDPTLNSSDNRIGDRINLKGVNIKMMIELNERYSDVTFRLFVVKTAKGDTPTRATFFNGLSGNKMLDTINFERYTVLFQKYFKIKAPAASVASPTEVGGTGSGIVMQTATRDNTLSRATKILNVWVPGRAFAKSGIITYEGQGSVSQPKFHDYHVLLYAYSNYSTLQDVYYVARVNDYIQTIKYKDC